MAGRGPVVEKGADQSQLPQTPGSSTSAPAGTPSEPLEMQQNRESCNSHPFASSSMTPPPTTQDRPRPFSPPPFPGTRAEQAQFLCTPMPSRSLLSSPPPTVERAFLATSEQVVGPAQGPPAKSEMGKAFTSEPQSAIEQMKLEMDKLSASMVEARTAAAHYKLQYSLLSIESEEAAKRMTVEQDMMRREVEVLRHTEPYQKQPPMLGNPASSPAQPQEMTGPSRAVYELEDHARGPESEKDRLKRRLRRAKKLIRYRDGEIHTLFQERERLRQRIRENREHFNAFRRTHGILDGETPRPLDSLLGTPLQRSDKRDGDPRTTPVSGARAGGPDTFAALLLADQVLSQETASAHPTPIRARPSRPGQSGHTRGTQSLSSLPSTSSMLRPPPSRVQQASYQADTVEMAAPHNPSKVSRISKRGHGRESRDSTISATDGDLDTPETVRKPSERADTVEESNASQLAAHMLRRSPALTKAGGVSSTIKVRRPSQTKLVGKIKKSGLHAHRDETYEKRHCTDETDRGHPTSDGRPSKLLRASGAVGLGIGPWGDSST